MINMKINSKIEKQKDRKIERQKNRKIDRQIDSTIFRGRSTFNTSTIRGTQINKGIQRKIYKKNIVRKVGR